MNLCECGLDFGSLEAFDRHRVGKHDFTFVQGVAMEPPRYDGRRCLAVSEIEELTDARGSCVFARNSRGSWSLARAVEGARERTHELRGAPTSA